MSREMVLVPLTDWKRLKEIVSVTSQAPPLLDTLPPAAEQKAGETTVIEEEARPTPASLPPEGLPKGESEMVELLPKAYRSRAGIIMHYLQPHLKLDQSKHVIFSDGSIGAHTLDYLRYVLKPLKKRAPSSVDKFVGLLQSAGVPEGVYSPISFLPLLENQLYKTHWLTL